MKKVTIIFSALLLLLLLLRIIPVSQQKEILIRNKIEHVNSFLSYPHNWTKWHPEVKAAWKRDTTSVHTLIDVKDTAFTLIMPGTEIKVLAMPGLQYHMQQSGEKNNADIIFTLSPSTENAGTNFSYAEQSKLLFRIFPFLHASGNADTIVRSLKNALEDVNAFYGFDISLQPAEKKLTS